MTLRHAGKGDQERPVSESTLPCADEKGGRARPARDPQAAAWLWLRPLARRLRYPALALLAAGLSLVSLQLLVGRQLVRQQTSQLANGVAANLLLGQVALERFSPAGLTTLSGMRLAVGERPAGSRDWSPEEQREQPLQEQAGRLRTELCHRLYPCPALRLAGDGSHGVWVEMNSALETVWLFVPLPAAVGWPPDPWLLSLSLGIGGLTVGLLFQLLEVQRPLRRLEQALTQVGLDAPSPSLAQRGTSAVRRLTGRFNTMVAQLQRNERERATMLAGIAHDLRSPLTRLRLRLQLAADADPGLGEAATDRPPPEQGPASANTAAGMNGLPTKTVAAIAADLDALERITGQFLVFAGADGQERPVLLPLHDLLAETAAAVVGTLPLELELTALQRRVRPTALARALTNLLENAIAHGQPPLRLVLRPQDAEPQGRPGSEPTHQGFEIQLWDRGPGISPDDWPRALTPFLRLDGARGGRGHSGLGLAIARRIASDHGGGLRRLESNGRFGVALWGRSLPPS